jgi:predicted DsbA family dithiol-disulfide isomerase
MSSRAEQKAEARAAREAAEREAAQAAARKKRLITFGGILAAAAAIIVAVVLVTGGGDDNGGDGKGGDGPQLAMFDGIAQEGAWLGDPNAPVVMEEYADLQCPFCKEFALNNLEPIIRDFVRSGEVRIRLRMIAILGPESEAAARWFQAAAQENRGWQFSEAFYAEQGIEGTGYADEKFLRARAEDAGLDPDKLAGAVASGPVTSAAQADQRAFEEAGLEGTPSFRIGPKDGKLRTVQIDQLPTELQKEVEKSQSAGD